jgi:rare lipoprotein A (peptidoglycan hydrolase)
VFWNISSRLIKKSHFLVVASLQVALLGPTSAANSKSDECGLASVYSTTGEETASGEDTQPQDFTIAAAFMPDYTGKDISMEYDEE